jgi:hypothetical protein
LNKSRLAIVGLGLCLAGLSQAGTLYGTDTQSNLYTIDTTTAAATLIGNHGLFLESLAFDGTNLYGASSSGILYSINTSTAAATAIGDTGLGNVESMDFSGGLLFAFDFAPQPTLFTLDTTTGAASSFVQSDTVTGSVRAFAFNPSSTVALMATDLPSSQTLHGMVPSGATTQIGFLGDEGVYGMDFVGADLFGLGGGGQLWQIDSATGSKSLIGNTGGNFWLDATTANNPVPEPATMAAMGLGLAALARRRRKSA